MQIIRPKNLDKALAVQLIRQLPGKMAREDSQEVLRQLGEQALEEILAAFDLKSKGGVDESGIYWQDLKPKTKAYTRDFPDRPRGGKRPTLSEKQDKRWRELFAWSYRSLLGQGIEDKQAGSHAAAYAWKTLKLEGASTLLQRYGNQPVDILVKTGALRNSFKILSMDANSVTIGSDSPYAAAHHWGTRHLPARQFWVDQVIPVRWSERWMNTVLDFAKGLLGRLFT